MDTEKIMQDLNRRFAAPLPENASLITHLKYFFHFIRNFVSTGRAKNMFGCGTLFPRNIASKNYECEQVDKRLSPKL